MIAIGQSDNSEPPEVARCYLSIALQQQTRRTLHEDSDQL